MDAFTYSVESCTSRSESVASVTFPERLQPRNDLEDERNKFLLGTCTNSTIYDTGTMANFSVNFNHIVWNQTCN